MCVKLHSSLYRTVLKIVAKQECAHVLMWCKGAMFQNSDTEIERVEEKRLCLNQQLTVRSLVTEILLHERRELKVWNIKNYLTLQQTCVLKIKS